MKRLKLMNVRCMCCKEKGHEAEGCPRDPNIRRVSEMKGEEDRIA
jgi:hypothetical protein